MFAMAVAITGLFAFFSVRQTQDLVFENSRTVALSVAVSAAAQVDGDLHETLRRAEDQDTPVYKQIEQELRTIRDANRRDDLSVKFIYTMRLVSTEPDKWIYVVDAEEEGDDKSPLGEEVTWEGQENDPLILGEASAEEKFIQDDYGNWLSACAPIRNSAGEIVAMLGVDIKAGDVVSQTNEIIVNSLLGLALALILAVLLSYFLVRKVCAPLDLVTSGIRKIGSGHLEFRVEGDRNDEFGEIYHAVNEMAQSLQERDALKGNLSRFVSQEVAGQLIESGDLPKKEGDRREITLLKCDIQNLHRFAEEQTPSKSLEIVNRYCREMVEIIFRHQGTVDRLGSDGVIAAFGALGKSKSHQTLAIKAAAELLEANQEMNSKLELSGDSRFKVKIAIHTGMATLGNVGCDHRVDFTVMGEAIDFVKKIEMLHGEYSTNVLISETTHSAASKSFRFSEVGDFEPAPLRDMIRLFTLRNDKLEAI